MSTQWADTRWPAARTIVLSLAWALVLTLLPLPQSHRTAWAQSGSTEQRLLSALGEAEELYETLDLEMAAERVVDAIELAESVGYSGPALANLYLMMGIIESALGDDNSLVVDAFAAGLAIDQNAELNPYYATPTLRQLFEQATEMVPEQPVGSQTTTTTTTTSPPGQLVQHTPPATIRAGEPVPLVAITEGSFGIDRILLSYRSAGSRAYEHRDLTQVRQGEFVGEIPGGYTEEGIQVEYFLEALGRSNELLEQSGSSSYPHAVIILHEGAAPTPRDRIVTIVAGPGTGGGLATGEPVVMGSDVDLNPGVAITPLHFYLDATFALAGGFELGPFVRLQTVLLTDGVELETILGGKLKWFFTDGEPLRMYLSFGGGWGNVRHTVDLKPTVDFVDTTREGPYHGGIGFGIAYLFNKHVGLVADIYTMVLFDQVSVQLDLNAGILVSF
ncbi:MAG: hypothetical protein JW797_17110 [Bradymonadales bacterium]|nr:hypothetical protein [Bradymonadales bacterium]